jgi:hypothetical protein
LDLTEGGSAKYGGGEAQKKLLKIKKRDLGETPKYFDNSGLVAIIGHY